MHVLTPQSGRNRRPFVFRNDLLPTAFVLLGLLVLIGLATAYDRPTDPAAPPFDGAALTAALSAFELIFLYAVLRPWSYDGNWGRAASAALLFLPSVLMSVALGPAGPVPALHAVWAVGMEAALVLTAAVSGACRVLDQASVPRVTSAPVEVP